MHHVLSVIMLKIKLICVGKLKEHFYSDAAKEYIKRLTAYCKIEIVEVSEQRLPPEPSEASIMAALLKESSAISSALPADSMTVALCVEGNEMSSIELSEFLKGCANSGSSRICFVIGGSYGLHGSIKASADLGLSLSKMTFPHNLARIVLLEQLYRAFNMAEGGKYHK